MSEAITSHESINWLLKEVNETKRLLEEHIERPKITSKWRSRKEVMEFLGYADTQMGALEKSGQIIVSKIGNRKFIDVDSILKLLEDNIQND